MIVFPFGAAVIAAVFAFATWRAARPRETALRIWSIAIAQFALACGALVWGIGLGWTPLVYRVFYLFGAVLNVAWLALGTVWLFARPRVAGVVNVLFIVAATGASGIVMGAELIPGAERLLATADLPAPGAVMPDLPRMFSRIFSIGGSVVVLGGLLWAVARRRHALGLGLLALGVVFAAIASELIRAGRVELFSVGLVVAIAVMYAGFLRTRT